MRSSLNGYPFTISAVCRQRSVQQTPEIITWVMRIRRLKPPVNKCNFEVLKYKEELVYYYVPCYRIIRNRKELEEIYGCSPDNYMAAQLVCAVQEDWPPPKGV